MVTNMLTRINIKERRGSIATEAAILLPLFVIGILTVGYLVKFCMISEGVHHSLADEAHRAMAEASVGLPPIQIRQDLERRITYESRSEAKNVSADRFSYPAFGSSAGGRMYADLIAVSVTFDTPFRLPQVFRGEASGERTVLCRAFVGTEQRGPPKPFSEMEKDDGSGTVWIFPRAGERYHGERCSYIANNPREVLLDRNVRSRYNPCKLCKPAARRDGTLVYCFETSGKVYHLGECYIVDRYVIEVGREDAEKQGYTPCAKCGGK
ncbi:MAG: hypothetical protein FWH32_03020 [Clostridiales bacterium]|nr:hypothetical protein [Clostridiales bacterium]